MECEKARELFSEYYDGVSDEETAVAFEAHLNGCPACAADYAGYKNLFNEIKALHEEEVPPDLHEKMMSAAAAASGQSTKPTDSIRRRIRELKPFAYAGGGIAACFILISLLVTGAADISDAIRAKAPSLAGAEMSAARLENSVLFDAADSAVQEEAASKGAGAEAGIMRMIAAPTGTNDLLAAEYYSQTFSISLTVPDLEKAAETINGLSGYPLSSNADFGTDGGGSGRYNRRVDISEYESVKETLRRMGKVESETESTQKLADEVFDMEARLAAKEEECARLLALLEQSKTMEVMTAVEQQYSSANSVREDYKGRLNQMYNQVSYPYLDIVVTGLPPEPVALPEKTYTQKLNAAFIHSVNGFAEFAENAALTVTGAALPLLLIFVVAWCVYMHRKRRKNHKNTLLLLIFTAIAISGCGASPEYTTGESAPVNEIAYDADQAAPPVPMPTAEPLIPSGEIAPDYAAAGEDDGAFPDVPVENAGEKILQTGYVNLKTDAFDSVAESLRKAASDAGGFIEQSNTYQNGYDYNNNPLRVFDITLRVPRDKFDEVLKQAEGPGVLESSSRNAEDVTAEYYDIAERLETKLVEEERVLDMITRANKIEDLLTLESRLGEIRTQIEIYRSRINNIDRLAAYSSIHVTVRETPAAELVVVSEGFGGRLQLAFIRSVNNTAVFLQNALLFIVEIFIPLLFILFLASVGFVIYKKKKRT